MLTDSLDVGCGEDYCGTVNVDLYPFDSTQGRYRWRKGFIRNLSNVANLVKATVNMLPFKTDSINIVYCKHLIEHEEVNLVQACKELLRVAKHQVIITTPSSTSASRKAVGHNKILTTEAFHILFKKYKHTVKYTRFQLRNTLMPFKWLQQLCRLKKRFKMPMPFYYLWSPIPSELTVTVEMKKRDQKR